MKTKSVATDADTVFSKAISISWDLPFIPAVKCKPATMSTKIECKNNPKGTKAEIYSISSRTASPKVRGICAKHESVGSKHMGVDREYVVAKRAHDNAKFWSPVTKAKSKTKTKTKVSTGKVRLASSKGDKGRKALLAKCMALSREDLAFLQSKKGAPLVSARSLPTRFSSSSRDAVLRPGRSTKKSPSRASPPKASPPKASPPKASPYSVQRISEVIRSLSGPKAVSPQVVVQKAKINTGRRKMKYV